MTEHQINPEQLAAFAQTLKNDEKAAGTIAKYLRDIRAFVHWLAGRAVNKEMTLAWRETLLAQNYAPEIGRAHV